MDTAEDAISAIAQRRSRSLTGIVREELERMILTGELKAGERLNEQGLATRLGISRGPIREAARTLERDGLVTCIVNQGVFVRQLSIEEAVELYELRAVVVGYACGCAAERATEGEKNEIRSLVTQMDAAAADENAAGYYDLNLRFHDRLMEISRHKKSVEIYQSLVKEAHLFRRRSLLSPEAMRESNSEHARMLHAIEAGDSAAARAAGEAHHLNGKRRWLETLQ